MTIYNLGSINADHFYSVPHLPTPGETLAATEIRTGLGGKGANQSVAAAKAGATVQHIGAVGADGNWAVERLSSYGVGVDNVVQTPDATGHAIINVAVDGENAIVLYRGANYGFDSGVIFDALMDAGPDDILLIQNETAHQKIAAELAHAKGCKVMYSAAPFDVDSVRDVLPFVSILAMNEIEKDQLLAALETNIADLPIDEIIVTKGPEGAELYRRDGAITRVDSHLVEVVDTTAAGDTFAGYFAAARDQGLGNQQALERASAAAAIKVTRAGTADAIPTREDVEAFIADL